MKKIIVGLCLVAGFTLPAFSQDGNVKKERYPVYIISKDVQRLQFRNTAYAPAVVTTGDLSSVSSKGVHLMHAKGSAKSFVAIRREGMPSSVISKSVARMQYEKK